jgi:RNA polymerase sigma-70 factor, ECF subfamily
MDDRDAATQLVRRALAGDVTAIRPLVDELAPVVHARVARALLRSGTGRQQGRDLRQEIEDFSQEVFVALFDRDAKTLRGWDSARGLSLRNFVGLVAEHQVASILRSGKRNPWTEEPTVGPVLDGAVGAVADTPDERLHSRGVLEQVLERLRAELSPKGLHLFHLLIVEERDAEAVCAETGLSADAVYAWRSRLGKLVRRLADEVESSAVVSESDSGPSRRISRAKEHRTP